MALLAAEVQHKRLVIKVTHVLHQEVQLVPVLIATWQIVGTMDADQLGVKGIQELTELEEME